MTKQNRIILLFLLLLTMGNAPAIAADYLLNISANEKETIKVYRMNGVAIPNEGSVTAGDTYRVIATCSDENYLFDHLEVTGGNNIVVEDKEKGECTFVVSGAGSVTVKAVFVGKPLTIELKAPEAERGSYSVICNGKKIQDKGTIPYGSAIIVIAEPKEGYATETIKVNGNEISGENNQYLISEVTEGVSVIAMFKEILPVIKFSTSSLLSLKVYVGDNELESGQTVSYGTKITIVCESNFGRVCLLRVNDEYPILKQEAINKFSCEYIVKENIEIVKLKEVNKANVKTNVEHVSTEYDGKPKSFPSFNILPNGLEGFNVSYKKKSDAEFSAERPIETGEYDVLISRSEDTFYKSYTSKKKLTITKAPIIIDVLPIVVFDGNEAKLKGGSAVFQGNSISGTFSFVTGPTQTGLTEVLFTPLDTEHYTNAKCFVPVTFGGEITYYKINIAPMSSYLSLLVRNGDAIVKEGEMVAEGTVLKLSVVGLSEKQQVKEFTNQISATETETLPDVFQVVKNYQLSVTLKEKESLPELTLTKSTDFKQYIGVPQPFSTIGIAKGNAGSIGYNDWIITYTNKTTNEKVMAPMNVGEYKMDLYYPSDGKYASFRGEGTFTITSGDPNAVFTNIKVSSVAESLPLSFSSITGGVSDVPGTFTWKDPSLKVYNGKEYEIVFTPTDPNYKIMSTKVVVPVTSVAFLSFAPQNGTISVVNKATNQTLKSGDWLSVGDELVIKAQPFSGYTLQTLSVNGYSVLNGSSYFVGDKPLNIQAVFEDCSTPSVPYYTVTIPEVTGAIVSNAGSNRVKEGDSFSFMIDYDLLYGVPTVTAGKKSLAYDGAYTYTLTQVTQDTTVAISLPKYGHYSLTTSVDATLATIQIKPIRTDLKAGIIGYTYGTELELTAIPVDGVRFYSWWDGNTDNPRIYRVRSNQKIGANFRGTPTDMGGVAKTLDIQCAGNHLYIQTDAACKARIIDMHGRMVDQFIVSGSATYLVSQPGVYIVILYKENQPVLTRKIKIGQ